ncbi:hypothetical protein B0H10DRAFT_2372424 [Mycena sp. CBHHK59/15]|nr:hypothetical protein B0H10DRAFT_2372424 [Mycena sp. CBHHK59/15]
MPDTSSKCQILARFQLKMPDSSLRYLKTPHFGHILFRACGLVEIFWHGQLDYHGTLNSTDQEGYTHCGTSIQITTEGVNAMQKVWNVEQLANSVHDVHHLAPKSSSRITTAKNCIDRGRADIVRSNKGKTRS